MFRSIASAITRALKSVNAALFDFWNFMLRTASEVALFPFAAIASFNGLHRRPSAAHASDADAGVRRGGLRRAISPEPGARAQADTDAVSAVQDYCRANPAARDHYDLSALPRDVQDALLDLGDLEVAALAQADVRAIRAFIAGENHGILGLPRVRQIEDRDGGPVPSGMSLGEQVVNRRQERMSREQERAPGTMAL